jgi:hypothetical protein
MSLSTAAGSEISAEKPLKKETGSFLRGEIFSV